MTSWDFSRDGGGVRGFFDRRRFDSLAAPHRIPIGAWLADARATSPRSSVESLLLAAACSIEVSAVLDGVRTYYGYDGSIGAVQAPLLSGPSTLVASSSPDGIRVRLGASGIDQNARVRHSSDWESCARSTAPDRRR